MNDKGGDIMIPEKIGFIGLGHIGGSVAKTVHRIYPDIPDRRL